MAGAALPLPARGLMGCSISCHNPAKAILLPASRWSFFSGGVWVLIGTIIMEGAAMSLESKVKVILYIMDIDCSVGVLWQL